MCGIAFKKKEDFEGYFNFAAKRGTDGIGMVDKTLSTYKFHAEDLTFFREKGKEKRYYYPVGGKEVPFKSYADFYSRILRDFAKTQEDGSFFLMHHRKATSGDKSLDNSHPFEGDRFVVMQNGTSPDFESWATIEGIECGKPDSYYLSVWINRMESLEDVISNLGSLSVELGVVVVVDKKSGKILYFSDGERSFHFCLTDGGKKIEYASSLDKQGFDDDKNVGYMVFDFEGNVIENGIRELNEKIAKKKASAYYGNSVYDKNDEFYSKDPCYEWKVGIGGLTGKWEFVSKIDDPDDKGYSLKKGWFFSPVDWRWKIFPSRDEYLEMMDVGGYESECLFDEWYSHTQSEELEELYETYQTSGIEMAMEALEEASEIISELEEYDPETAKLYKEKFYGT